MNYVEIIKKRVLIDGKLYRRYFVDDSGSAIGIPIGITCGAYGKGNYVVNHNLVRSRKEIPRAMFPYRDALSQQAAIKDMIAYCERNGGKDLSTCNSTRNKKRTVPAREDFVGIKLPYGICLFKSAKNNVQISISCYDDAKKRFHHRTVYCGTENTWRQNFKSKLEQAIRIRRANLAHYNKLTSSECE